MTLFPSCASPSLLARLMSKARAAKVTASSEGRQAAPRPGFTPADWNELFEHWHRARALGPERVIDWRERREVSRYMHSYPADAQVCGGRHGAARMAAAH